MVVPSHASTAAGPAVEAWDAVKAETIAVNAAWIVQPARLAPTADNRLRLQLPGLRAGLSAPLSHRV